MTDTRSDEVSGIIDDLMARLTRLRERYGERSKEEGEPPKPAAPFAPPAPVPAPALSGTRPRRSPRAEWVRESIALFIVFFGLTAIVVGWFALGIGETERAAAILIGVIGTVVGFYFGQRGAIQAQDLVEEAMRRVLGMRAANLEEFMALAVGAKSKARFLKRILEAAETDKDLARKLDELRKSSV